ncbi:MAG TPA: DUF6526 family protein [Thermoanaerobaculia bacterium]|nr:DUF6526 family protein [Thermoanaerobaculia bacterium]
MNQSFESHRRFHPLFHYFIIPILGLNLVWSVVNSIRSPDLDNVRQAVVAAALVALAFVTRIYALRVQDRLIRLEERLRLQRLLPPEHASQAAKITDRQLIALRFCDDAELAEIVGRIAGGELRGRKAIKRAIRTWRPDDLRV